MATISQFGKGEKKGITIASLPMPDGSKKTYKERLATPALTIRYIIKKWKADCAAMELAMFLAGEAI